jgi:DMSO/TMAO reductase YedYZ molybdopterin-dependent catalytic subunit
MKAERLAEYSLKRGLTSGLIAGGFMVLATIVLRLTVSAFSITELAADWFTSVLPGQVIDFLLETLSFSAKPLMFVGLLVAQVIIGGLLGILYTTISNRWPLEESAEWGRAIAFGAALWILSLLILVPAFGGGFFASEAPGGTLRFALLSLIPFGVYSIALAVLLSDAHRGSTQSARYNQRRDFLKKAGIWAAVITVGIYSVDFLIKLGRAQMSPSRAFRTQGVLSTEITPNDEFYVVSKNIIDPTVSLSDWSLEIKGLVENSFTLTYDELRAMPSVEEFVTLECISNPVGGSLISNARWKGVPLKRVLERAGLNPGIADVSFQAWDGYTESIPLEMAMRDEVMIAYEMNGKPLPDEHGFPARLIVPGYFGLKHVKWLTAIEPVNTDFKGYWQRRGWTDAPYVKTFSRFDIPQNRAEIVGEAVPLGGVAFAGDRGISKVEISGDDGQTWTPASEISQPLSPYTWVIWKTNYSPGRVGQIVLSVRATDGDGIVQTSEEQDTLPDGATGHHEIVVNFRDSST